MTPCAADHTTYIAGFPFLRPSPTHQSPTRLDHTAPHTPTHTRSTHMTWFDYTLLGLWILGMLLAISAIGKPKKPTEPLTAAVIVAIDLLLIAGLLWTRGVL